MGSVSAGHVSEAWWREACKKMKNAVVFLDNPTAECLHWSGGLDRLAKAGAKNVKEFSSFESGNPGDVKAVFLVSVAVRDTTATILHDIIKASKFEYCVVISSAHPNVHTYARYGGREADEGALVAELERDVLTWMGDMNYTVEFFHFPLVIVPYSETLFFMPPFARLYPLLPSDVPRLSELQQVASKGEKVKPLESLGEVEFPHLPYERRVLVRQFVSCMHSLLQAMNAREEIYTVGHTSRIVGTELDTFNPARQRRKTATNKVSLVLVDGTLDLCHGSSQGGGNTLMGRILDLLPRLPAHHIDSAINMAPLCSLHPSSEWSLMPGCLAPQGEEERAAKVLQAMVTASTKDTLTLINKHVVEASCRKDSSVDSEGKGRVTLESLEKNLQHFASDIEAFTENAALIQQGLAAVECLSDSRYAHLDQLLSLEKLIIQSIGDPEESPPFTQIFQLLKTRKAHGVTLEEILSLMTYAVSLGGPDILTPKEEYALVNLLSQALVEDRNNLSDTMMELVGEEVDEVSALKTAQGVARQLHAIASAREHLINYRHTHLPGDSAQPAEYRSLLPRLVRDCLTAPQGEIADLQYRSAGLKDLIKTGFSLFVNVSKPMPRDAPMMIVYIIGGISPGEVREIHQMVDDIEPACDVILASSHLSYPSDVVARALKCHTFL